MMTSRERYLSAVLFGHPDRVPLEPGHGRKSTLRAWHSQGLSKEVGDYNEYAYRLAGGTLPWPEGGPWFWINARMVPQFEARVLEKKEGSLIVQDWKGNVCEIGDEYTVEYLDSITDFVTRRWIKCPVETQEDWEGMKKRYDATLPSRFPENPKQLGAAMANRSYHCNLHFSGPFWQLREWCGFEGLCTMFYDNPKLVEAMLECWSDFVDRLLEQAFAWFTPDEVHLSEDMAYKSFSMISPEMARKYLLPVWKRWGERIRAAGVPVYGMDSDGFIGELIPLWIEAGINVTDPIEVAAGNDIVAFRREFGKDMAYRGGVDKRAMAKGGKVIEAEIDRLRPLIDDGGFIPSCDHGVPADIHWDDYCYYVKLLAQATGWL